MARFGEDDIRGFLNDLENKIAQAADAKYGDLSIDDSISSRNAYDQVSDIAGELPDVEDISLDMHPKDTQAWCERSLDQLEMTIQLLDQCIDNDFKDLNRQQGIIDMCSKQVKEMKQKFNY